MKIKSNVEHNISFCRQHGASAAPEYCTIVAGATLEMDDKLWLSAYAGPATAAIEAGALTITEEPVTTLTAKQIVELIEDQVGVTVDPKKPKAELQTIANKLGVVLS